MEKSWIFVFFQNYGKLIIQGKGHGKIMKFCKNRQFRARYNYGYGSVLVCISKFTTFFHSLSCMYFNVCVVMVVAVRGGHLYFSI